MGAKFWSAEEKRFFIEEIVPRSRYAQPDNDTGERLDWEQLVPIMQEAMDAIGGDRRYTKTSLFQHHYQKVGTRARLRGEAEAVAGSRAHRYRGKYPPTQASRRQNRGQDSEDEDDDTEDERPAHVPSPDLPPIPQHFTRRTTPQLESRAGRSALFNEESDGGQEDEFMSQFQAPQQAGQSIPSMATPQGRKKSKKAEKSPNNDFMDDDSDIPGKAEDEAWEERQRLKRKKKKQGGQPTKRPRGALDDAPEDDDNSHEEEEFVPRKRQILPKKKPPQREEISDSDSDSDDDMNQGRYRSANSQSKRSRPNGRQPGRAEPTGKLIYNEKYQSRNDDELNPYRLADRYASSSSYYADRGMGFEYPEQYRPREQRLEEYYDYSVYRGEGNYADSYDRHSQSLRQPTYRSEQPAPKKPKPEPGHRPAQRQPSSNSHRSNQMGRESSEYGSRYEGMNQSRAPAGRYEPSEDLRPYQSMGCYAEQAAGSSRYSSDSRPRDSYPSYPPTASGASDYRPRRPETRRLEGDHKRKRLSPYALEPAHSDTRRDHHNISRAPEFKAAPLQSRNIPADRTAPPEQTTSPNAAPAASISASQAATTNDASRTSHNNVAHTPGSGPTLAPSNKQTEAERKTEQSAPSKTEEQ